MFGAGRAKDSGVALPPVVVEPLVVVGPLVVSASVTDCCSAMSKRSRCSHQRWQRGIAQGRCHHLRPMRNGSIAIIGRGSGIVVIVVLPT